MSGTAPPTQIILSGSKAARPADPSTPGYSFLGWYTDDGQLWDFTTDVVVRNISLHARWVINRYAVSFDLNGGTGEPPATQQIAYNQRCAQPRNPARNSYFFNGWFTDAACTHLFAFQTPITQNISLHAGWLKVCRVSFDTNGIAEHAPPDQVIPKGGRAEKPEIPAAKGHSFLGWYLSNGVQWDFDRDTVTGDITLYAKWKVDSYDVIFDLNGAPADTPGTQQIAYEQMAAEPEAPLREGYTFTGWYTDPDCGNPYSFSSPVTGDIMLYAG